MIHKMLSLLVFLSVLLEPAHAHKVDCVGAWGYCGKKCLETFKISTPASGGGKPCSARNQDKRRCTGGNCKNPSPGPSPGPAPGPGGLHNIFNGAEVEQCYGLISKDPQLVRVENRIFMVTNCRRGGPVGGAAAADDFLQSNYTALAAGRRRLDPTSKSVTIVKSSDDEGKTWDNFRVLSQNGWSGGYYYGAKGIYDQKRKRLIIQWTDNSHGASVKLWQVTSDDQGKTFSKPRDMTQILSRCAPGGQPRSGNTAGNRIQLPLQQYPNGRVLFGTGAAFVPRSGSASWMCLWYSEDGGETYNTTKPLKPNVGEFSMVVANTNNGRLLVNGRQNMGGKTNSRQNYWSSDGGLSWDGPHDSGLKGAVSDNGSGCEASITNVNNVLYFFNPSGGGPGDHPSRTNMQVQCSKDNGKSWKSSYKVTTTTEGGYSDIMGVSGGKLLLVWGIGDSNVKNPQRNMYAQTIDTSWCK